MVDSDRPKDGEESSQDIGNTLEPPSVNLPKGGGAIRGIGEKFGANPVTGTGSMVVPIATSPGRSGFGPQLSLSYDSGSGNGPFGFGWSLSLPTIARKTDKGLPQYRDATESDEFILAGAEDLVPVLGSDGNRFEDDSSVTGYTIHRYRPRIEGVFARIERWTRNDGDVHWRSISKDNILTLYGKDANSRIADPDDPRRIFSWLISETRDDKGNAVVYEYKQEDGAGVDLARACECNRGERDDSRRTANRYLKHVRYGNRASLLDDSGHRPYFLTESQVGNAGWVFELVFDYGEHDANTPRPNDSGQWAYRADPFSSYRAGFEARTCRVCERVLMFHHFEDEAGVGENCLVRSTDFTYSHEQDPASARNAIYTFLLAVGQTGYKREGDGYLNSSLPPVEFEYTPAEVQDAVEEMDASSLENLPIGVDGTAYRWTDLHGEGIPGILTEQGDAWFYKRNLSPISEQPVEFAPQERVTAKPKPALAGGARFMDLAGDGQLDLVVLDGPTPGLYEHDGKGSWQPYRPFTSRLNRDSRDPHLKFVDLNGDGHSDVLITEDEAFVWHQSLAEAGFGPARHVHQALDEEQGPRLVFADSAQSIYLADLSGDGLTDLVRLRNGEVCYWPNLGYGRFGAKVTMDRAPYFDHPDQFDHKRIRLADIDGSGTTDIIYLHSDGVRLYFNQSGNGWSDPRVLNGYPSVGEPSGIMVTDLLGNGTACLVWSSPLPRDQRRPMRYIKLIDGQKPHLLTKTVNNLGAETRVRYAPSTKFYLQDKRDGKPWFTRLPFPVHVVEQVETHDHISRNRFVTRYAYHHGYFDGSEREFRGFGMVEQWDTEEYASIEGNEDFLSSSNFAQSAHVPPVHTKIWFHMGIDMGRDRVSNFFAGLLDVHDLGEYYREPAWSNDDDEAAKQLLQDTLLPDRLTTDEAREACRALKGSMLRQEVYADDGTDKAEHPYSVIEQNFAVSRLQPLDGNRHAVFFSHASEAIRYHYERNPADPRIAHTMTLEVGDFGNVLKKVDIGYRRREIVHVVNDEGSIDAIPNPALEQLSPDTREKQLQTLVTYTENRVTSPIDTGEHFRAPLVCETRSYELSGYPATGAAGRFRISDFVRKDPADPGGRKQNHIFDSNLDYEEAPSGGRQRRLIGHVRSLFRPNDLGVSADNPLTLLPLATLESLALPGETYRLAFTPGLLEGVFQRSREGLPPENLLPNPADTLPVDLTAGQFGDRGGYVEMDGDGCWWIPSGRAFFSPAEGDTPGAERDYARRHFFTPHRFRDPFGQSTTVAYDYDLLIRESRDVLQNTSAAANDFRVLQPEQITGPNGNRTAVAFDALGMVVATAVMGKAGEIDPENTGDTLEDPTTRLEYELFAWQAHGQPNFVHTYAREQHGAANPRWQESYLYSDGFGRELQTKVQAEAGDAPQRDPATATPFKPGTLLRDADDKPMLAHSEQRWVGAGRTVYNNKGKPVKQYDPFFSSTPLYEDEMELVETGVTPILFYDPVGRVVATLHPNHTWEKVLFDPWHQESWDVNDTLHPLQTYDPRFPDALPDHRFNPVNDPDLGHYFQRLAEQDYLPTWYDLRMDPLLSTAEWPDSAIRENERQAAVKAAQHASTPAIAHLDVLGRSFVTVADNGLDEAGNARKYSTRVELDIEGKQREFIDAKARIVMRYEYGLLGSRIHQTSMEAGKRWMLNDVTGKPILAWDGTNQRFRNEYDPLRRPLNSYVIGADPDSPDLELLVERAVYGETLPSPERHNLRGQVIQLFDQAGVLTNDDYDFKGNLLRSTRTLADDYKKRFHWDEDSVQASWERFTSSTSYDALNRPMQFIAPHSDRPGTKINVIQPGYNEANLLEQVNVWLSQDTDPANLLDPASANLNAVADIEYDAKGQRTRIDYGNGAGTIYKYDPQTFRLVQLLTVRGRKDAAECSPLSDPRSCQDPPAICSRLPTNKCILQNLHYSYDPAGNITHIRDHAQQIIYFRNTDIRPDADYRYDALYRLIEATGREHLGQNGSGVLPPTPTSDTDSPRVGLLHANDRNAMGRYVQRYLYDEVGNFLEMSHCGTGPVHPARPCWTRTYAYDETSLIEDGTDGNPPVNSNRLSTTSIGTSTETYHYDGNVGLHGNMTAMPHLPLMDWDFKDQLRASSRQVVSGGTAETTYYVYDAAGQRVRKVSERQASAGITPGKKNERIYLKGFEIYREYSGTGAGPQLERETLHVMDDQQRIALVETKTIDTGVGVVRPEAVTRFQFSNHLGSSSMELDENARLISYEEYYPYGSTSYQAVSGTVEVSAKRYRYSGMERDEETGLNYHGARYYSGWLGKWVSCDPIGISGGQNLYQYVSANPIAKIDPQGTLDEQSIPPTPVDDFLAEIQADYQVSIPEWEDVGLEEIEGSFPLPSSEPERAEIRPGSTSTPSGRSGPRWYQEVGFSYRTGRNDIFETVSSVDTGYGPVADFAWAGIMGLHNLCTMPFNAVSEAAAIPNDVLRFLGAGEGDIEAFNIYLMTIGVGEINMLTQSLRAARMASVTRTGTTVSRAQTIRSGGSTFTEGLATEGIIGRRINTGQGIIQSENCAYCTTAATSSVRSTSSSVAMRAGMAEGGVPSMGPLLEAEGLIVQGETAAMTAGSRGQAISFMRSFPRGTQFAVVYSHAAGGRHAIHARSSLLGLRLRDFQASLFSTARWRPITPNASSFEVWITSSPSH